MHPQVSEWSCLGISPVHRHKPSALLSPMHLQTAWTTSQTQRITITHMFLSSQDHIPAMHWPIYYAFHSSTLLLVGSQLCICSQNKDALHCLQASLICTSPSLTHLGSGAALFVMSLCNKFLFVLGAVCIHCSCQHMQTSSASFRHPTTCSFLFAFAQLSTL